MLYVPPLWFHYVESLEAGVAANFWTDSLASDTWLQLTNRSAEDSDNAGTWHGLFSHSADAIHVLRRGGALVRTVLSLTSLGESPTKKAGAAADVPGDWQRRVPNCGRSGRAEEEEGEARSGHARHLKHLTGAAARTKRFSTAGAAA